MTNGVLTSSKDNNFIKISTSLFTKKYVSTTKGNFNVPKANFRVTFPLKEKIVEIKPDEDEDEEKEKEKEKEKEMEKEKEDFSENSLVLQDEAGKLQQKALDLAKKAKLAKMTINGMEQKFGELELEIKKMSGDRDKHKEMYTNLMKSKIESKIVIDSQKRLLNKYII